LEDFLERIERTVLLVALALLTIACFVVLRPFLSALLWAAILALATWPLFCRVRAGFGGRGGLAAGMMTAVVVFLIVVPLAAGGIAVMQHAEAWIEMARGLAERGVPPPPAWVASLPLVGDWIQVRWLAFSHDGAGLVRELKPLLDPARQAALGVARSLGEGVLTLGLSALLVFFFWRDGDELAARVRRLAERIAGERALRLAEVAHGTIRGTVYGLLGTALAQGILAAIGLAVAGVPGAVVLGVATFFLSVAPMGPPLIWGPAAFWLYDRGDMGWAIFLVVWGTVVVSGIDNVLKPMLISRGSNLPFILVMVGVLGGVLAFGFVGVFLGPTLLAVAYRLMDEWTATAPAQG
jgi:predicted PurR-regulated permease PerM